MRITIFDNFCSWAAGAVTKGTPAAVGCGQYGAAGRRLTCAEAPEALISRITWRGPGVGSGNSLSSSLRSPRNTTPFMILLRCAVFGVLAWLGVHLIVKSPAS